MYLTDNTLVIVTSDNGPWFEGSTGAFRGNKGMSLEGVFVVPLIASWPARIPKASKTAAIGMGIDLLPTVADVAGKPITHPIGVLQSLIGHLGFGCTHTPRPFVAVRGY